MIHTNLAIGDVVMRFMAFGDYFAQIRGYDPVERVVVIERLDEPGDQLRVELERFVYLKLP